MINAFKIELDKVCKKTGYNSINNMIACVNDKYRETASIAEVKRKFELMPQPNFNKTVNFKGRGFKWWDAMSKYSNISDIDLENLKDIYKINQAINRVIEGVEDKKSSKNLLTPVLFWHSFFENMDMHRCSAYVVKNDLGLDVIEKNSISYVNWIRHISYLIFINSNHSKSFSYFDAPCLVEIQIKEEYDMSNKNNIYFIYEKSLGYRFVKIIKKITKLDSQASNIVYCYGLDTALSLITDEIQILGQAKGAFYASADI